MKLLIAVAAALGGFLLLLLTLASGNTPLFTRQYPWLLVGNLVVALSLVGLVGWQFALLAREHRAKVFGSKLKLRLVLFFGLMAVVPGALVYGVSVRFVTKSIESWFDVRVEKALESGLNLGRSALDTRLAEFTARGRAVAQELADRPDVQRRVMLNRLREQADAETALLVTAQGQLLASASAGLSNLLPALPTTSQLKQARLNRGLAEVEGEGGQDLTLRVLLPISTFSLGEEPRYLQLSQPVPKALAANAEAVQAVYRDYQELALARSGLTRLYALSLTLTLLLALLGAIALAFVLARRLSAPLSILAEGTQAVAAGDFTPRQAIYSRDELGVLTQSFSRMTRQLDDARRETERHRAELESARAYLEEILGNLSAGVLAFDRRFVLHAANQGAGHILGDDLTGLIGEPADSWPRLADYGRAIRDAFADNPDEDWQREVDLVGTDGAHRILLVRGSTLPAASGGGFVVVFDDVSQLIAAQRAAAWGEVARRLAHEIKNPLTPIQLSAERLQVKLADKLANGDADLLQRSTTTIINQVQAMKHMVDDFRDYARLPPPELRPLDLNALVGEVLGLYETSQVPVVADLSPDLPPVLGDATQLRQIIHNLLRNAQDAVEGLGGSGVEEATGPAPAPRIELTTALAGRYAELLVADNGCGFPAEVLARAFEPYTTTKAKGTGLGLAIVRKIADEHGGDVILSNRAPRGALIRVRIPLATAPADARPVA
ncbi:sensory transduction histidine kinase [Oryzomicrobium terrae]|uniref:histidine kinase n=1 Tax=Oryzomicrobium terrae TaxID=1735038 RepID=A0A5C1E3L6_9RHOO|nr:ATP-binding protein [Oryzomicrobium terrae]QEL63501.1 sensory transduction histidine kinase [Oryzomicrobium terrae]